MEICISVINIRQRLALICLLLGVLLAGCDRQPEQQAGPQYSSGTTAAKPKVFRFAIHPMYNPQKLSHVYQPLIDHLNRQLPDRVFELEASRDYPAYEAKFRAREPDFLLPNPWQTLQAMKVGYHIIAMAGDAKDFKGIFIVRQDSSIREPADVKGKSVSYPAPTALAACIMPQYFLHTRGININHDISNHYVGTQDSSIMSAYLKQVDIAVTWPPPWRAFVKDHPEEAAQLRVIWETPPLLNNSVMVRDDVPASLSTQVQEILLNLEKTEAGRALLANMETARFHSADDTSYEVVRDYISRFEKEVRPIEAK